MLPIDSVRPDENMNDLIELTSLFVYENDIKNIKFHLVDSSNVWSIWNIQYRNVLCATR